MVELAEPIIVDRALALLALAEKSNILGLAKAVLDQAEEIRVLKAERNSLKALVDAQQKCADANAKTFERLTKERDALRARICILTEGQGG